ncbi:MAG: hypothetical protein ACRDPA_21045 [Solirubrobacteraceae bacterium]
MITIGLTEPRELAHRTNNGIDVTLFWSKASNRVTICVFHARSATALEFEVDGADALDAFNHPYAYAATDGAHHILTPRGVTAP